MLRHLLRKHRVTIYAIAAPLAGAAGAYREGLPGSDEKHFQISRWGYAWNGFRGFFGKLPLQAKLYESDDLRQALAVDVQRGEIDVVLVHLVRMAEYARPLDGVPRVLDMNDSIHLHYSRMPFRPHHPIWLASRVERRRLARYESELPRWFDWVLMSSPVDLAWVRDRCGRSNFALVTHGVDLEELPFSEGPFQPHRIVFLGKLDYFPNADAALHFAREILPLVKRSVPQAHFVVVGWNPPKAVRSLARLPAVTVLPNVPDARGEVAKSALSVAPLRFGAGIQVKVLDSLALGIPVVASEGAARAFGEEGKTAILVGQDPAQFAGHVIRILKDSDYRERLRRAGRALVESRYRWEQVLSPVDRILETFSQGRVGIASRSAVGSY
jgi:hypothetical protein